MDETLCTFVDALDQNPTPDECQDEISRGWSMKDVKVDDDGDNWSNMKDAWTDVSRIFDNWLLRLIDTGYCISKPGKLLKSEHMDRTIDGMLKDGLIGHSDANELRYIGDLWMRLSELLFEQC